MTFHVILKASELLITTILIHLRNNFFKFQLVTSYVQKQIYLLEHRTGNSLIEDFA